MKEEKPLFVKITNFTYVKEKKKIKESYFINANEIKGVYPVYLKGKVIYHVILYSNNRLNTTNYISKKDYERIKDR